MAQTTTQGPVAFLGAGNMAGAIAQGIASEPGAPRIRLTTGSSRPAWIDGLSQVSHESLADAPDANLRAVEGAAVVILGVKPYAIVELAEAISPALAEGTLVISVAGGITLDTLRSALPDHVEVVRAMPNTPVAVNRGVTAIAVVPGTAPEVLERAAALLAPTGSVEVLDEDLIDAFSAVVGSGPAHVYYFVEALRAAAVEQGLSAEVAARVVPAMIGGAIEYLESTGRAPEDLRREVTSPGGSTAEAIAVFDDRDLKAVVGAGIAAATAKAKSMGKPA
ncbi:pyrroline-5-carboxylate reductase [Demequina aurantiaca]|uniref:pyrroline-5-carboxylate reductase n=1 Tax=Demequina aurantiaca TaxID=676200 RepID=UPI000786571D|nr:pyrroline-5-carboxylate reductase [Demequina aurantiaca]